jgi:hypothetical protein
MAVKEGLMSGKQILAIIFAVLVLVKLAALLIFPGKWLYFGAMLLDHPLMLTLVDLVLLAIVGYYVFASLGLVDIAVVMLFTSLLIGLSLAPYATPMIQFGQSMASIGIGKAWISLIIWAAMAVAVLIKVFYKKQA